MAITFDAAYQPSAADTYSWSHTVGSGDNKVLLVFAGSHSDTTVTSVTFNSVSLTKLVSASGAYRLAEIWYLVNPPEGEFTVAVTRSGGNDCSLSSASFFGVDQSNPFRASNTATGAGYTPSLSVDSESNDMVVDVICYYGLTDVGTVAGVDQTRRWVDTYAGNTYKSSGSTKAGSPSSTTMSWTISPTGDSNYAMAAGSLVSSASSDADDTLPSLTITASSNGVVDSLPLLSLVNCYVDVPHSDVIESLPIFTISATALQSTVIAGDCTLPVFTMTSTSGFQSAGDADVDFPIPVALASSLTGEIHTGDCDVPFFTISATLLNGGISKGVASLPFLTFSGRTINTGTASNSVPVLTINGYAHGPLLHTLDESLPLLQIVATLVHASTAFRCYVLNTENSAITEYDNFPFNSFATFKGKHLAAGSNGITLLEGNRDNSTDINAYLNVGNNDFDLSNIKKITDAYLSMKGDGSYYLTVTSDDGTPHSYLLSATTGDRIKNLKTNVGKGKKGRYFELELSNIAGADFELYDMVLNVELLKRNI